jgi:hypothetical protein
VPRLQEIGAAAIYPTGTELDAMVKSMRELCSKPRGPLVHEGLDG